MDRVLSGLSSSGSSRRVEACAPRIRQPSLLARAPGPTQRPPFQQPPRGSNHLRRIRPRTLVGRTDSENNSETSNQTNPNSTPVAAAASPPLPSGAALALSPPTSTAQSTPHSMGVLEPGFVLGFGVCNRVLYKMALVPLQDFPITLGSGLSIAYSVVYSMILFARHKAGKVSDAMLQYPKAKFLLIGIVDALGLVLGNIGAARLPGVLIPILSQTVLFWQLAFACVLLKKAFNMQQVLGVALVGLGVALAAIQPGLSPLEPSILTGVPTESLLFYLASVALPALSAVAKEQIFTESTKKLGKPLDIFVVNTFSSIVQAIGVVCLLPVFFSVRGLPLATMPDYFINGFKGFFGLTDEARARGAPFTPLLYLAVNVGFSISILRFLRTHGSMMSTVLWSMIMPLSVWVFTCDLPFIGPAPRLGPVFYLGVLVLCFGVYIYNLGRSKMEELRVPVPPPPGSPTPPAVRTARAVAFDDVKNGFAV